MSDFENKRNRGAGQRSRAQRRRDRRVGIDRFGRWLPRHAGTNPRALAASNDARAASGGNGAGRVPHRLLDDFVRSERISCFACNRHKVAWAAGGWREPHERDGNPCWVICVPCVRRRKELRQAA